MSVSQVAELLENDALLGVFKDQIAKFDGNGQPVKENVGGENMRDVKLQIGQLYRDYIGQYFYSPRAGVVLYSPNCTKDAPVSIMNNRRVHCNRLSRISNPKMERKFYAWYQRTQSKNIMVGALTGNGYSGYGG